MLKLNPTSYQYLLHILDEENTKDALEYATHSEIFISEYREQHYSNIYLSIGFKVHPEIFKKYQNSISQLEFEIKQKLILITKRRFKRTESMPDLSKFKIIRHSFEPVFTKWEQINSEQQRIIQQLRQASNEVEFQNIGNSCRTLLQNLADILFNAENHTAPDNIKLDKGSFKNRLHTIIKSELESSSAKEMKDFSLSAITTAEKSIDLANKVTHDLKANQLQAETCVISTISVIAILKLVMG